MSSTIVFYAPRYHTNQVNISRLLIERGYTIYFHVERQSRIEDYYWLRPNVVQMSSISFLGFKKQILNCKNYYKLLRRHRPSVIIIRDPNRLNSLLVALIARLQRVKIVFYTQMQVNKRYSILRILGYNGLILFFNANWYSPVYGSPGERKKNFIRRLFYLPFPIVPQFNSDLYGKSRRSLRLLCVGKFEARKNQIALIHVFSILLGKYDIHLTLVGEVSTAEHRQWFNEVSLNIIERKLQKHITVLTNVEPNQMQPHYREADIFILPSYREPASISIVEAMSYGLPVIVSDDCGNKDYVLNGFSGWHFINKNNFSLLRRIHKLVVEEELRLSMSRNTRFLVENMYNNEIFYRVFTKIIS